MNEEKLIQCVLDHLRPPEVYTGNGEAGAVEAGAAGVLLPHPEPVVQEQHDNAGQLLVEIIRMSRDSLITATPSERFYNPLLAAAESPDIVHVSQD